MKRMLTALLCLALALSACAAPAAPPEAGAAPSAAPAAPEAEPLEWLFPPLEDSSCGAASETGFYEVLPRDASGMASPGGYNLCFTDFATLTRVPVCADPGCAHDSEACTGWLAENTSVAVWNGKLILGNLDGSGFQWLDCMEPDGSNRHRLITLPANLSLLEPVAASGQAFYGVGVSVDPNDPEAKPSAGLYRLDPATGQTTQLLPLAGQDAASVLVGLGDGALYLKRFLPDGDDAFGIHEVYAVTTDGQTAGQPVRWKGTAYTGGYFTGGQLFLLEHATGKLERIDPATGQRTAVGTLPDTDYQVATLQGVWDGRLLVKTWKHLDDARATNVTRQFAVDLTTSQIAELPLPGENRVGEAVPYPLLAEWDSQFLVETGTRLIDSHLAVISKEDFWAGKAAYTPITDAR